MLGLGFMLMGENSYDVTNRLRSKFGEVQQSLPAGVHMNVVYDRTLLVNRVIETVKNNLCEGAYLVVLLLFLILGNLRAGFIAAVAIPLSMMVRFLRDVVTGNRYASLLESRRDRFRHRGRQFGRRHRKHHSPGLGRIVAIVRAANGCKLSVTRPARFAFPPCLGN